ncbi:MAG: hypothetical protein VX278_02250 [Myxococcota bacterium]|nr:hypothetical protein [Myxococcota bacterium]
MRSAEIQKVLGLSKGAVSMLMQDLEQWKVVVANKDQKPRTYVANEHIAQMIIGVFRQREAGLLKRTKRILEEAHREAQQDQASPKKLQRIQSMLNLATFMNQFLNMLSSLNPLNVQTLIQKFSTKT